MDIPCRITLQHRLAAQEKFRHQNRAICSSTATEAVLTTLRCYIGGGMVIHASNPRDGIKISNAYYRHPAKIGRVMN